MRNILFVLLASGCELLKVSSPTPSAPPPDVNGPAASQVSEGGRQRQLLDSLVGMTPEKATDTVKAAKPAWKVRVTTPRSSGGGNAYDAKCGAGKVCAAETEGDPDSWGEVVLFVNRNVAISAPD